jgi:hypothetical protein
VGVILVMTAVVAGRSTIGHRPRPNRPAAVSVPVVMAAVPSDVLTVGMKGRNARVEIDRSSRGWQPRPGTTAASAALLGEREGDLFPLRAYRVLKTEESRPDYGLADPEFIVDVDEAGGRNETVEVGAPSFNGEGFYARRRGDPHVYLLTRRAVDGLRSALRGEPVATPRADPERERLATAEQLSDPELTTNPWLAQILTETDP